MASAPRRRQKALPELSTSVPGAKADVGDGALGADARIKPSNHGASRFARDLVNWRPGLRSADADLLPDQGTLKSRSRDLMRNNGIAKGGIQTVVDNVVGVGLRLNPRPNYVVLGKTKEWADEWSAQVRAQWLPWAETTACDAADTMILDQLTAQCLRTQLVSGEATALPLWIPDRGDGWATKIQSVDPDRLSQPAGYIETLNFRSGIEQDAYGAPIAYWFRKSHPGDFMMNMTVASWEWERVPKYTDFGRRRVIHCYDKERSGLSRGAPVLSSVLSNFKGLDRYTAAEIQAAVVNAMIAMVIQTPLDQEGIQALFQGDEKKYLDSRREHAVDIQSGTAMTLFPGDTMQPFTPARPASGFGNFVQNVTGIIALALDMPGQLLMKDFTQANYSSMRAAMLEAWRSFNRRRDDLGTQWADPIYALWLEEAVNAGKVDAPDFYKNKAAYTRCKWIGPGRGWVDPVKEATAAGIRLESRISTLEKECAEQGEDWREVLEQIALENAYKKQLGIPEVVIGRATVVPEDDADAAGLPTPGAPPNPTKPNNGGAAAEANV